MKEVTIIVPNKVGELAAITEDLGNNGINILSISAMGFEDKGVVHLITSDERSALRVLNKRGLDVRLSDVLVVTIPDRPGELAKIVKKISRAGINIEGVYQLKKDKGIAEIVIKPENIDEALAVLHENNVRV